MTESAARPVRFFLVGVGHVGRRFLDLIVRKEAQLRLLGLQPVLAGVADSRGTASNPAGLDIRRVLALKDAGQSAGAYPEFGHPGQPARALLEGMPADLLVDASPANLTDGQPGLGCIEAALSRGMHVVTANKAPLVLAYPRLQALAEAQGVGLRFDATVTGGLPAINLGRRDLAVAHIGRIEGLLNLTANYILARMAGGHTYEEALADAQEAGHAEADPTLDVDGWDAASKLVILAHSVLHYPATLDDVAVQGIRGVDRDELCQAEEAGGRVKLVATAEWDGEGYCLEVAPRCLPASHPLARLGAKTMGIVYHTDINGTVTASIEEETPEPTAAAVLRDVVDLFGY
ncbi:MAG: homoserine dehydrogenase [Anaerolineae bacterium]|nr:homoserine dehydrogenase [Anaerolineae bacterium]